MSARGHIFLRRCERFIFVSIPSSAGSIGGGVCGLIDEAHAYWYWLMRVLAFPEVYVDPTRITISRKPQKKEELPVSRSSDRTGADSCAKSWMLYITPGQTNERIEMNLTHHRIMSAMYGYSAHPNESNVRRPGALFSLPPQLAYLYCPRRASNHHHQQRRVKRVKHPYSNIALSPVTQGQCISSSLLRELMLRM